MTSERCWQLTWETGPDAGECWQADAGPHVVGRAPQAEIRCDDSALEPFHVQLGLDGAEPVVRQLAGRLPVRVRPTGGDASGPWRVQLGHSDLSIDRATDAAATGGPIGADLRVIRVPRHLATWSPEPVHIEPEPNAPAAPTGGLVPTVASLLATVVVALVVRQMMFVVVGAVGTTVAASTWITARVVHRRKRREHRAMVAANRVRATIELAQQRRSHADHVRLTVPTLARAVVAVRRGDGLWQRRSADADAWWVSLGMGAVTWQPVADGEVPFDDGGRLDLAIDDLPVAIDLRAGTRLAVSGPHASSLTNALVIQLAALTGPADWQLVVVTASPGQWRWTRFLPHARDATSRHLVVDEVALLQLVRDGSLNGRHTVVVTDQAAMLTVRTSALRRLESAHESLAMVVIHDGAVPALCRSSVVTMSDGRARFVAELAAASAPVMLRLAGSPAESAERLARILCDRRDPEDERLNGHDIPATVGLSELMAEAGIDVVDAASIVGAWSRAGHDPAPRTPIGRASDGVVEIDLVRDGPHALLAGTTGAGKSELLRSMVVGLSCTLGPQHLTFVLVDYKGGAAFDDLAALPHVVGVVTDLDQHMAERALRSLRAELTVREELLRRHGANDLTTLRARAGEPVVPRILVVVDEFAALAVEQPEFLHALVGIAQRGRSLGVHLLLATQRPSGVISDDIRANTNLRMALRLHDVTDAMDVVGDPAPATLSRSLPGRAVMRLGPDELVTFQAAHTVEVDRIVLSVRAAGVAQHIAAPRSVWCAPLPECLDIGDVMQLTGDAPRGALGVMGVIGVIGVMDLPDEQTQRPYCWSAADGSALVVGSVGSGVTSTLITLATATLAMDDELFVIDAGGDARWDAVAGQPSCAGVVRLHERERLWRLLHRVASTPTARLVIDGLGALRHELEAIERSSELELLDRIVTAGEALLLVGAERVAAISPAMASRCAVRLVLHLHDPHEAAMLGVRSASVPAAIAGRAVIGGSGVAVQLVAPRALHGTGGRQRRVAPVDVLPAEVFVADLPSSTVTAEGWRVPIGVGFGRLEPLSIDVADGEHVLIAGSARTGRSTALAHLCVEWLASHPFAQLVVVAGRRSPVPAALADHVPTRSVVVHGRIEAALIDVQAALAEGRQVMLAVDDAELVDDPSGSLAAMIADRTGGLLVVAAGRPDALRQAYGHWTAAVRRSRLGLLSSGAQDVDADLFGATLPRRPLLSPRPGLVHLIDGGSVELVQLALPDATSSSRVERVSVRAS